MSEVELLLLEMSRFSNSLSFAVSERKLSAYFIQNYICLRTWMTKADICLESVCTWFCMRRGMANMRKHIRYPEIKWKKKKKKSCVRNSLQRTIPGVNCALGLWPQMGPQSDLFSVCEQELQSCDHGCAKGPKPCWQLISCKSEGPTKLEYWLLFLLRYWDTVLWTIQSSPRYIWAGTIQLGGEIWKCGTARALSIRSFIQQNCAASGRKGHMEDTMIADLDKTH